VAHSLDTGRARSYTRFQQGAGTCPQKEPNDDEEEDHFSKSDRENKNGGGCAIAKNIRQKTCKRYGKIKEGTRQENGETRGKREGNEEKKKVAKKKSSSAKKARRAKKATAKEETTQKMRKTPFNKKQLEKFRALLVHERKRFSEDIAFLSGDLLSAKQSAGDLSNYSKHMADQGTDNFRQELNLSLVSTDHDILWEINDALKRIDDGTYGICEISGKAIKVARLQAVPYARFTVETQGKIEQGQLTYRPLGNTLKHGN